MTDGKHLAINKRIKLDTTTTTTRAIGGFIPGSTTLCDGTSIPEEQCTHCDEAGGLDEVETKKRFQGRHAFLTYSAPTKDPEDLWRLVSKSHIEAMCNFRWVNNPLKRYIIARETHKNGKQHFHVLLEWMTKPQFPNLRFADLDVVDGFTVHPNIQKKVEKGKTKNNWWEVKWCYCLKQDPDPIQMNNNVFPVFTGFVKKYNDMSAWLEYTKVENLKPCFPLTIFGMYLGEPRPEERVRGYVFYGSPGCGKSKGMGDVFRDRKVYQRPPGDGRYPFDSYVGQQVILYDDCMSVNDEELINCMNVHQISTNVGPTRNVNRFWPRDQVRVIMWFCNIEGLYILRSDRIRSRFLVRRAPGCTYGAADIDKAAFDFNLSEIETKPLIVNTI